MLSISQQIEKQITTEVAKRHASFIKALREGMNTAIKAALNGYTATSLNTAHRLPATPKARTRAVITPAIKAKVIALVKAGKAAGEIAKATGISLPSVQNIKKAAGLVQARKK